MSISDFLKEDKHFEPVAPNDNGYVFFFAIAGIALFAFVHFFSPGSKKVEVDDPPMADINPAGLAEPIIRIVYEDNTCAGVVRADGNADGECPAEAANLPTVSYAEILPTT